MNNWNEGEYWGRYKLEGKWDKGKEVESNKRKGRWTWRRKEKRRGWRGREGGKVEEEKEGVVAATGRATCISGCKNSVLNWMLLEPDFTLMYNCCCWELLSYYVISINCVMSSMALLSFSSTTASIFSPKRINNRNHSRAVNNAWLGIYEFKHSYYVSRFFLYFFSFSSSPTSFATASS